MHEVGVDEADRLDAEAAKRVLRRAGRMLGPYRRQVVGACGLLVVWTLTTLAGPLLVRYGIDQGITPGDAAALNAAVIAYVLVAIVAYVVYRSQVRVVSQVGESFLRDLRLRVFDKLQRLSMPFYDREKAGVVVSRMTSDIDSMAELVQMGLLQFVSNVLLLVLSIVVLVVVSWQLALVCLIALPFVVLASIKFQRDSNEAYLVVRDQIGGTLSNFQESIAGVRVIQAFGRERTETRRFAERNRVLYDAHMQSVKVQAWYLPVIEFAGIGTTAAVVGVGGWLVSQGTVTIGTVTFFVLTLSNLFEPVQQLSQLFNTVQSAGAGLQKVFQVLDEPVEVQERPGAVDLAPRGDLVVDRVSFAYGDGPPVLRSVDLTIPSGERLALSAHRRRKIHAGQALPVVRPRRGSGDLRRGRPARRHDALAAPAHRGGAPGGLPVRRIHPGQRARRAPGRLRCRCRGRPRDHRGARPVRLLARRTGDRGARAGLTALRG